MSTSSSATRDDDGARASSSSSSSEAGGGARPPVAFDCNICLDAVASPVVTLCGHLYCWPCLYQWLETHSECPVCKAGVSVENVIPVYARGADAVDPRSPDAGDGGGIPSRPRGQRPDAELLRRRRPRGTGFPTHADAPFVMFPTLAFFPALFGIPFQQPPVSATHRADGTPLTPMELRQQRQQAFLSRLLLVVGSLVILCLLLF